MPLPCTLRFLDDDVLQIHRGAGPPRPSLALDPSTAWNGPSSLERAEHGRTLVLRTPALTARLDHARGVLAVATADGRSLLEEIAPPTLTDRDLRLALRLRPGEALYGLGDRPTDLDRRGGRFTLWNTDAFDFQRGTDPLYKTFPFLLGLLADGRCYGLFVDCFAPGTVDAGATDPATLTLTFEEDALTCYLLHAPTPLEVLERYGRLTGRTPMLPRWALGYHQCRYSYRSEQEVRAVARAFRDRAIPCDTLYFDIHYMDGFRVFTWDPRAFPNPAALVADLHADGFTTVAIVDPGVKADDPGYPPLEEGLHHGFFVRDAHGQPYRGVVWPGPCHFPDFFRSDVRTWWGDLHRPLLDAGIDGIWCDMNEPAVFTERMASPPLPTEAVPPPERTMPDDNVHVLDGREVPHRRVHNAYGLQMLRATWEGLRRLRPNRRPFTLTRAAFAGAQRFGTTWTGDNAATWDHLRLALEQCLALGIGGMPFCGADVGGFSGKPTAELLVRWTQLGTITPLFRNHSAVDTPPQEPWRFGRRAEAACRAAIRLRYRLLPYLYTVLEETARTGVPLLRALPVVHPDDPRVRSFADAPGAYIGPDLLAYPVLEPGRRHVDAWLPAVPGGWYDLHSGRPLEGGRMHRLEAPLDRLPLLVRAGTVLPLGPPGPTTAWPPGHPLTLRVYPGPKRASSFLYDDAGDGWAHETGAYYRCRFDLEPTHDGLAVHVTEEGDHAPPWFTWHVEPVGCGPQARVVPDLPHPDPRRMGGTTENELPRGASFRISR